MPVCSTNKVKSTNTEFKKKRVFSRRKYPTLNRGGEFSLAANLVERDFARV